MFTKMVLPRLGGAPTVWSVAMVFFQAALLAGYAYAHLLIRFLPLGYGALVHLVILATAATTLPIGIAFGFEAPPTTDIASGCWLFTVSIGLPFAVLSASAPLLQGWFAASGHPQASNPYVLYSASNLGSLAALIAYPIAIEPLLSLNFQTHLWSFGFAALAVLVAAAALFVIGRPSLTRSATPSAQPTLGARLAWIVLAAIPRLVIAVCLLPPMSRRIFCGCCVALYPRALSVFEIILGLHQIVTAIVCGRALGRFSCSAATRSIGRWRSRST
jgi:hypothetical protein